MEESLGRFLSSSRIKRGLSITEVASITRINEKFIRSVEDDRFDELPGDVFIKGFLRTYAKQLELDGDELVAQYDALHIEHSDQSPDLISIPLRPKSSRLPIIGIIIILTALGIYAYFYFQLENIVRSGQNTIISPGEPSPPEPKEAVKAPKSEENKEFSSGNKLNKPEKAKVSNTTAPKIKNTLATKKAPPGATKPKIVKPAKEKETKMNVVIP